MNKILKDKVISLRKKGKTYSEICGLLGVKISKSTLSEWCKNIPLPLGYKRKVREYNLFNLKKARIASIESATIRRKNKIQKLHKIYSNFPEIIRDKNTAKIVLSVLYLGEGSKNPKRGSMVFGNSDVEVIRFFLHLLRYCYNIDESKFRCTIQCRADQDIQKLEKFWTEATNISLKQFYKARIDPRTIGKLSIKKGYKGVLRIDYFSAEILQELLEIPRILMGL
ncbi:MAG: hypothetical protein WC466_09830 [Candidatus Izemoplasmatales bacterium]|jgi:hypothetical protein